MCKAIKEKFKHHFSFNPFTEKEVINFIPKLPTNKPSVPNDTLMFIPKQPLHVYCSKLTNIMNGCLKNKKFLDNIENTQITSCHKKKKKEIRKTTDQSVYSHVFEKY